MAIRGEGAQVHQSPLCRQGTTRHAASFQGQIFTETERVERAHGRRYQTAQEQADRIEWCDRRTCYRVARGSLRGQTVRVCFIGKQVVSRSLTLKGVGDLRIQRAALDQLRQHRSARSRTDPD